MIDTGIRDGKPFRAIHRFPTSLRTTPDALLRLVRECWRIESCQWIRHTQLREDDHRYRGNGAGVMAALRTAGLNLLRLTGFDSIREGLQAVMHDITALLAMARRRPQERPASKFESALIVSGQQLHLRRSLPRVSQGFRMLAYDIKGMLALGGVTTHQGMAS